MNSSKFSLRPHWAPSGYLRRGAAAAGMAAALLGGITGVAPAHAVLTVYTDVTLWTAALPPAPAPTLIDFDGLADNTPLAAQFAGVSFSAFNGGNPLAATYSFTQSGLNVVSLADPPLTGGGGGVAIALAQPVQGIGFWYLDSQFSGNWVSVLNSASQVLGSYEMAFPRPVEWLFVGFIDSSKGIRRVEVAIGAADMVALDSLQISAVPEPASAALLLAGVALLGSLRRRAALSGLALTLGQAVGLGGRCRNPGSAHV